MQQKQLPPSDEDQYFSVRKKHFFITFLLVILIIVFSIRYLFSHGLYVGFTPPPEPSPPLSQELISRFHQLEEQLNKTIQDVNEVYQLKEKLNTPGLKKEPNKNKDGKG